MNAARIVAAALVKHWIWSNANSIHELIVAEKIFNIMTKFKAVDHYLQKKHSKPSCVAKKASL